MSNNTEYYLDNAATTKVDENVIDQITNVMKNFYGNPSSLHDIGVQSKNIVNNSRKIIADYITCSPPEIIFTSGACEANSLAICGYMNDHDAVLITSKTEHKSILSICDNDKYKVEFVDVDEDGFVDLEQLEELCKKYSRTCEILVSIQAANSETGLIQDIKKISKIVHKYRVVFHTDVTQLFPYEKMNVKELNIDMMSMSGQKIHAPKGVGFLYVKKGIKLQPLIYGSQENGLRGGTENVPYIAGIGQAVKNLNKKPNDLEQVRDYMMERLLLTIPNCKINGDKAKRLPNNINVSFKNVDGEALLLLLNFDQIYVSSGSACDSTNILPSPTLKAMNISEDFIYGTIRITLPDDFTMSDADYVIEKIKKRVESLRVINAAN